MGVIKSRIIRIGNSQGLRIPKVLLEQLSLRDGVELEVQENQLIVRPHRVARQNWDEQFRAIAANEDERLLDDIEPGLSSTDEASEWS